MASIQHNVYQSSRLFAQTLTQWLALNVSHKKIEGEREILQRFLDLQEETSNEFYLDIESYCANSCFTEDLSTNTSTSSNYYIPYPIPYQRKRDNLVD